MAEEKVAFQESSLSTRPLRDLGLAIEGTELQPLVAQVVRELEAAGLTRFRPRFYLSTEWGVPFDTIAVAIPFYLARADLARLHLERAGHVEGTSPRDILRYLRHEVGHVINYAYRLYDRGDWVEQFGSMTQPYVEEYTPQPFSRRFVRHLPGWYAQKHPDEDWAETFAVWLEPAGTAGWREEYAGWPVALGKLEYCERVVREVSASDPICVDEELDEDVGEIDTTLEEFYGSGDQEEAAPPGLDGALRSIFDADVAPAAGEDSPRAAGALLRAIEAELLGQVYRWTGHFPERTRALVRTLARRADELGLTYGAAHEQKSIIAVTTLVAALAMNHVEHGSYLSH